MRYQDHYLHLKRKVFYNRGLIVQNRHMYQVLSTSRQESLSSILLSDLQGFRVISVLFLISKRVLTQFSSPLYLLQSSCLFQYRFQSSSIIHLQPSHYPFNPTIGLLGLISSFLSTRVTLTNPSSTLSQVYLCMCVLTYDRDTHTCVCTCIYPVCMYIHLVT